MSQTESPEGQRGGRPFPNVVAIALVTGSSAAVLMIEILATRLLAPFVGMTLETYTAVIGTVLAGIAAGTFLGGWAADRFGSRNLLPGLFVVGGALALAAAPVVRALGRGSTSAIVLAAVGFIPSTAVLSAVSPAVVKLQLRDLVRTGTTVGRFSAWGTGGAIAGTFLAGYVLVEFAAVTTLMTTIGVACVVVGMVLWWTSRRTALAMPVALLLVPVSILGAVAVDDPCDHQTAYYCVTIDQDPDRATGRVLTLDGITNSYVDLADPTHLGFWYVRRIAAAIDAHAAPGPLRVTSLGAGALTLPGWIRATRPGSEQTVIEIDDRLIQIAEEDLGFVRGPDIDIVHDDARVGLAARLAASADVVIGDTFGHLSVPWHLTTREFVREVARVMTPEGIYVVNVIDGGEQRLVKAVGATIAEVFPHVSVALSASLDQGGVGNAVVLASRSPLDVAAWKSAGPAGDAGRFVEDVPAYLAGAVILTDDHAPVDQLLTTGR